MSQFKLSRLEWRKICEVEGIISTPEQVALFEYFDRLNLGQLLQNENIILSDNIKLLIKIKQL